MESRQGLTISRLIVKAADQTDTGDYACSSDAGASNSTAIHVITGKAPFMYAIIFFVLLAAFYADASLEVAFATFIIGTRAICTVCILLSAALF